jgi:hypothetical protein
VIFRLSGRRKIFFRQKYFRAPEALSDIARAERRGRSGKFLAALWDRGSKKIFKTRAPTP